MLGLGIAPGAGCRCRVGTIAAAHTVLGAQYSAARLAGETCPVLRSAPPVHPAPPASPLSEQIEWIPCIASICWTEILQYIQIVTRSAMISFRPLTKCLDREIDNRRRHTSPTIRI